MRSSVLALLFFACASQAGVIIGGTRFVFAENKKSISVTLKNRSAQTWLISSKISSGSAWPGNDGAVRPVIPFTATPPLFALHGNSENIIRLVGSGAGLAQDRETLFMLSIAAIPSGKAPPGSVQMAVRSNLKLFYRPADLPGDPARAYQALVWQRTARGLTVENNTPYFVTLFKLSINGEAIDNPGVVAPFSKRQTPWCQASSRCQLSWQSLNDYGRVMPAVVTSVYTTSQGVSSRVITSASPSR